MSLRVENQVWFRPLANCLLTFAFASAYCMAQNDPPSLILQTGHKFPVTRLDMTRDGKTLASSDFNGVIKIWDVPSGQELFTLNSNDEPKRPGNMSFQLDPLGKWVASVGFMTRQVIVRTTEPGAQGKLLPDSERITKLVLDADGTMLVGLREDGTLRAWDTRTWKLDPRFSNSRGCKEWHSTSGMDESYGNQLIAFSKDGSKIIVEDMQGGITTWLVSNGCEAEHFALKGVTPSAIVCLSPDGSYAAISDYHTIRIWKLSEPDRPWSRKLEDYGLRQAVFSHDSKQLAIGSQGGDICLLDLETKVCAKVRSRPSQMFLAFSPNDSILAVGQFSGEIDLIQARSRVGEVRTLSTHVDVPIDFAVTNGSRSLLTSVGSGIETWHLESGARTTVPFLTGATGTRFTQNGDLYWTFAADGNLEIGHTSGSEKPRRFSGVDQQEEVVINETGSKIAISSSEGISILDTASLKSQDIGKVNHQSFDMLFSPSGGWLATRGITGQLMLFDLDMGGQRDLTVGTTDVKALSFSPDSDSLVAGYADGSLLRFDLRSHQREAILPGMSVSVSALAFDADGERLAVGRASGIIQVYSFASHDVVTLIGAEGAPAQLRFRDQRVLISLNEGDAVHLWDLKQKSELATLIDFKSGAWAVVGGDGRFDASDVEETGSSVKWRMTDDPAHLMPVEIFMRDYFTPKLLNKVLGPAPLPKMESLTRLNRVQPKVRVLRVFNEDDTAGTVAVQVEVNNQHSTVQKDSAGRFLASGVYDVRLFRDGQIVGTRPEVYGVEKNGPILTDADRASWRATNEVRINATGRARITFRHVRLPRRASVSKVIFTAYAFNRDRVKSPTSLPYEYTLPARKSPVATPRAYLITMGVDANQSRNLDLDLAVSSAEEARALLRAKLAADGYRVVEIPLYSKRDDFGSVESNEARKAYLEAVLYLLAGKHIDASLRDKVDLRRKLRAAGPDDSVILYIVSHGYADPQGVFYLMPYDTGPNWGVTEDQLNRCSHTFVAAPECYQPRDLLAHSISSDDLAAWWSGVDAGQMVMVLDSCHSGAVPGREFRPGPLGDPGFGQLSYDKGMQILSASQSTQTEKGTVTAGQDRTILVSVLKSIADDHAQQTLQQWFQETETALPLMAAKLYPALREDDIQLPLLLDFVKNDYQKPLS